MSLEHTTRAITENKYNMQLFADKKSLEADVTMMKKLKASNPSDDRVSDYDIKQKEYELSKIENQIKGRDYSSVKTQCEQYFTDNNTLFDRNQIITETRSMLSRGQTVNEWPHLAAVFLLDHANVTDAARQNLQAAKPPAPTTVPLPESLSPGESPVKPAVVVPPKEQPTKPVVTPSPKPQTVTAPIVQPKPENIPEILSVQQKIIFKDGAYYLTGPKGNTRRVETSELLVNLNLPKNAPENLKKSVKMIEDFSLLLDAYISANPKEITKHEAAVKQIQGLFAQEDIQMGKKILDVTSITSGMFDNFWRTLSDTDLKKVNDVFRIQDESARRLALLNFIRDGLGQSDIVLGNIMKNNPGEFPFPSDENILKNGDISAAGLSVSGRQKVADTIRKARQEAASNWTKNYKEYVAQFEAQNPGVQFDEETARKNNEELTILALAKREIMYQQLYNKDLKSKPELALAQDIMGAADFDMSDKSWDVSKEIGGMIAMEAIAIAAGVVTAGAATVAINAAMLGRNAYRGAKALEAYNEATKIKKALTTSARILGSGAGFEAGAATTRSYIENGDFTSMHSLEGYAQSVAMMGVMSGIGKLVTSGRLGQRIQFKEGAGFAKNALPFTGQVAIEGTAIFGTSAVIGSVFFDRRDNWTLEQMAQAMLMATLLKGAGRISASKNSKGEIEVKADFITDKKGNTKIVGHEPIPDATKGSSDNLGRYILDGKEYRWSSKQNAFLGKNNESYTREQFERLQLEKAPKLEYQKENLEIRWDETKMTWIDKNGKIYPKNTKIELDSTKYIYRNTDGAYLVPEKSGLVIKQKDGYDIAKVYEAPNGEFYIRRKAGTQGNWEKVESETPVQKAVEKPTQDTSGTTIPEGKKISSKNYDDFVDDIWKFDKKSPETRQLGDMTITYNKLSQRITVKKGQEPEKIFTSKDDFKGYIMSQDESMISTAMRNNRQAPRFESEWKVGTDKYLLTKEGNFYKNGTEMKLADLSTLSGAETQKLFSVLYESNKGQIFANTVKSKFSSGMKGTIDGTWYIASTPWKTNGVMSIPAYFTNLVRLPFINTRLVYETITTSGMANTQKFKDIVKTLVFSNKNGFDGFINGSITTLTTAAILYSQYMYVQEKQANGGLPADMSWMGEAWAVTHRFLQANNIIFPYDAWVEIISPRK